MIDNVLTLKQCANHILSKFIRKGKLPEIQKFVDNINSLLLALAENPNYPVIPTWYSDSRGVVYSFSNDIVYVADFSDLTKDEVSSIFSAISFLYKENGFYVDKDGCKITISLWSLQV